MRPKISIIGAGNVGATTAHLAALKGLGDIVLIDVVDGVPQGKALDILESLPLERRSVHVFGSTSYDAIAHSDIVVITAGLARKPGMSRDDLLLKNAEIVAGVSKQVRQYAPEAIVIVVSNPLDAMVHVAAAAGFPRRRVIGMAGVLDSTRFATFIAEAAGVSVENVQTLVLGGHGDQMIPLIECARISGMPLSQFLNPEQIATIVERTKNGGIEIVNYLKTGSAYYAPAASVVEMIDAILYDKKKILPCACWLEGEYGVSDVFIGVPAKLGRKGVEQVIELALSLKDKEAFYANVAHVREMVAKTGV
ncbi:MAG: malate dehydrogenase [Nanoarchaeota archaeon]|nr:malate dehydrogenase [Nanoarchaeota archaeon]